MCLKLQWLWAAHTSPEVADSVPSVSSDAVVVMAMEADSELHVPPVSSAMASLPFFMAMEAHGDPRSLLFHYGAQLHRLLRSGLQLCWLLRGGPLLRQLFVVVP